MRARSLSSAMAGSWARSGLSTPYSQTKNRLRGTPPVYQLPSSWKRPTLPMPAPAAIGTIAACAGWFRPARASCHSAEDEHWRGRDPIERVKTYLTSIDELDQAWLDDLDAQCEAFGEQVRAACHDLEVPPLETAFDRVHAETTLELSDQREQYLAWADSFGGQFDGEEEAR